MRHCRRPLTELPGDLRSGRLAPYTFIAPNLCNDEHNCGVSNEDDRGEDNHVHTVVAARSVRPGTVSLTPFTHCSMLRTNEQQLGLPPLGEAARAASMAAAVHLAG